MSWRLHPNRHYNDGMTRTLAIGLGFIALAATLLVAGDPQSAGSPLSDTARPAVDQTESAPEEAPEEEAPKPDAAQLEFFEKQIRPILVNRCTKCHGAEKQKGEFRLDSRAAILKGGESGLAVVPGKPDESELIKAIRYDADSYQMPPTGKLPDEEIARLTEWVEMGAPWPTETPAGTGAKTTSEFNLAERAKHWSFQPVKRPPIPVVKESGWPKSPVDNFVLAKLEAAELKPAIVTDKRTLLRRVTFDLIGLPPTPAELESFLSDDAPDAYEKVVDRLLASPHYGERWGRHWLDLVRYAETYGHEFDYEIAHAWRYRDYVVRAFNDDVPYDRFVVEHIAGDLVPEPRRNLTSGFNESVIGTGFYWFGQGKHSPVDIRAEECDTVDNQIDVLGKTFLGLTIACARCHDHKFDAITTKDYYALAGYLQSSRQQYADLYDPAATQQVGAELNALKADMRSTFEVAASIGEGATASRFLRQIASGGGTLKSPLLRALALSTLPAERFEAARQELAGELRSQAEAARRFRVQSVPLSRFAGGSYDGWYVAGDAFGSTPTRTIDFIAGDEHQPVGAFVAPGVAHSGLVSSKLQGTIRSATFTIEKRFLHYYVMRQGGRKNPGRAAKNGQIHLIVDGFQIIKDPLYGFLSLNVPQEDSPVWLRQDLSRFVGSRAYIEVADDDDGMISLGEVFLSDDPNPVVAAGEIAIGLVEDRFLATPEQFSARCGALIAETALAWNAGRIDELSSPAERVELLNLLNQSGAWRRAPATAAGNADKGLNPGDGSITNAANLSPGEFVSRYRRLEAQFPEPQLAIAMIDGSPENEHVLARGNHKKPGEVVSRRFLEVFGSSSPSDSTGSGRLELANKIAEPSNPLTARVIVNRLWHHHFGRGIVPTPDDFGHMGQLPSHAELLDFLALELIRKDWSIKPLHRLMVLSNAYRMSSSATDAVAEERDPQNVLLHRMPVRRLEGEALRDAMLALSGRLDRRLEGTSVLPHLTEFMEGRGRPGASGPLDGGGRRSIYINVRRNFLTPFFLAFDFPTPFTTTGRRSVSNVPAQALSMMNNPFVIEQAKLWSVRTASGEAAQRIQRLYSEAFGREPNEQEQSVAMSFLQANGKDGAIDESAWADLCHALWNVKEFAFVR